MLLISGCGSSPKWYKAGFAQRDFDLDARQCKLIATELAREASITKKPNIELYADQYAKCLIARGWVPGLPPATRAAPLKVEIAAPPPEGNWPVVDVNPDQRTLVAYGIRIQVPDSFRLLVQFKAPTDLNLRHNYMWGGDNKEILVISIQRSRGGVVFQNIPYPFTHEVDVLYDESGKSSRYPKWRAFCANRDGRATGLVGYIYRVDEHRRIMVAVSIPLPDGLPEAGSDLRLSVGQNAAMADFTDQWAAWIENTFPSSRDFWRLPFSPLEIFSRWER